MHQERQREPSDAELLAAHVAGDRYAFEELFYLLWTKVRLLESG